ncbi:hypothetical protein P171DRAFT_516791 [Karstenula rhodostoma CBS 690.94]|uniref:Uncharacterized protein n=1 Tax=Karstenula rhodostoma CBS 690.94 TaxID=1392251 RepID=A0A9P4PVM9_9PLEO|nr:hypothetical protein P171DRAFT_516791 [Karstenula rhodostoma CBS 690.94]
MASSYKYDIIAESDSKPVPENHSEPRSKTALALYLLAAALLGFLTSTTWFYISQLPPAKLHCGNSFADAQALGCKFDLLSSGWIPHQCFDEASETEYREWILNTNHSRRGPFPYFKDKELTQPIEGIDALSKYEDLIYTTMEEHLAHCTQLMRRTHRAALSGGRMAGLNADKDEGGAVVSSSHVAHCVKMIWRTEEVMIWVRIVANCERDRTLIRREVLREDDAYWPIEVPSTHVVSAGFDAEFIQMILDLVRGTELGTVQSQRWLAMTTLEEPSQE